MATLAVYQQNVLPAFVKWQALAFMRVEWSFIFSGSNKFLNETYPPELYPVHVAATEGDTLLSYAAMIRLNLEHAGTTYQAYGFGNMFTFPPYRREGHGRAVLNLATQYILRSDVDVAILFCDPPLEPFYAVYGWTTTQSPTYVGTPDQHEEHHVSRMMLFVSDKGKQNRAAYDVHPLYVEDSW